MALAALLAVSLLAPGGSAAKDKKKTNGTVQLAWPPPPEVARIRFLGQYQGEDVKGKKKRGFLERLAGVPEAASRENLVKPYGVAVDSKGRVFVADSALKLVFVFDLETRSLEYRGDKPPASFTKPIGVAVDGRDRLFVSDAERHNITCLDESGAVVAVFGTDVLVRPAGIATDLALNRLYVADAKARKVAVFDLASFNFLRWIGAVEAPAGKPTSYFIAPTNVAVDPDGLVYVVDSFADHILVFDPDGEPVRSVGGIGTGPGRFARPRGVAFDSDGHLYVVDGMTHRVQILTADGKPLMPMGGLGANPGQFNVPAAVAIDSQNRVFITDQVNRRIQVFRYVTEKQAAAERTKRADAGPADPAMKSEKRQ
jgi:DNA-binding beta-propeller fold protein YncE